MPNFDYTYAEAWQPEPNEKLEGTVTSISMASSEHGNYVVVEVQQDDGGKLAFHAFHTAARSQLDRLRPKVGDEIGILYEGLKTPKSGGDQYENYVIRGNSASGEFDWDAASK